MNRPSRKLAHLQAKVARKESLSHKKPGKRTKRWRKFAVAATAVIETLQNPVHVSPAAHAAPSAA